MLIKEMYTILLNVYVSFINKNWYYELQIKYIRVYTYTIILYSCFSDYTWIVKNKYSIKCSSDLFVIILYLETRFKHVFTVGRLFHPYNENYWLSSGWLLICHNAVIKSIEVVNVNVPSKQLKLVNRHRQYKFRSTVEPQTIQRHELFIRRCRRRILVYTVTDWLRIVFVFIFFI